MTRIFISYRRDDSAGYAGRLFDRLSDRFGRDQIFMDIDTIEPGLDFVEVIEQAVGSCDVLIALLGRRWLNVADAAGQRRLDNPEDFVRLEIKAALERNIRVIPALVDGAVMPRSADLPADLARLARRNAVELRHSRFHADVDHLIGVLEKVFAAPAFPRSQTERKAWERGKKDSPPRVGEGLGEGSPRQPFEPELILIPAGEFLMGSDPEKDKNAQDDEQPQHRLYLPDFYIAKTPVTNAQFAAFVKASGYRTTAEEQGEGWAWTGQKWDTVKGANWQHPRGPQSDITAKSDHPVVQVSWHDAVAYCRWLARATGRPYRLPTEAEWEKAARGPELAEGRIYPWGNKWETGRCNSDEAGVGDTSPVGAYPNGASPYGVLDMAGNVWEWCATKWQKAYPYEVKEDEWMGDYLAGTDGRVLRGGSWFNLSLARCAYRYGFSPGGRFSVSGFRLVSPI